jgi:ABC-2 type transport system ATP-binding protein
MDNDDAVQCIEIRKRFGDVLAVQDVSLTIARGECVGLLGPNGAGKTTTNEILHGLCAPDSGEVRLFGEPLYDDTRATRLRARARFGVQLQNSELPEHLSAAECVRLFRSFYPRGREVDELLALLALEDKRDARVADLSGGQRQRVALACALAGEPELLFLDEPTTGLDPQARLKVWSVVQDFRERGGSVLVTTHYMEEAAQLCDRVAIMDAGRVIALDTPRRLIEQLGAPEILELELACEDGETGFLSAIPGVASVRRHGRAISLTTSSLLDVLPLLLEGCRRSGNALIALRTHFATLEDVFVALTGRALRDG